jgi:hypothetical protein
MELTPNWLDAECAKPRANRIVCAMDRDGFIGYGWTIEKDNGYGNKAVEWKDPRTQWWVSLYELKQIAAWRRVVPKAHHYIGTETGCSERIIAWQRGLEGMPPQGAQILVRLDSICNFRHYGTGVARLARVGYSDHEDYEGFLTFVLEYPNDPGLEWPNSVVAWGYLPGETED